mgnify:CR=1 FL=1
MLFGAAKVLGIIGDEAFAMAVAVIFGLAVATLLTLIVVPVVYSLVEGLKGRVVGVVSSEGVEPVAAGAARGTADRV